jgi:hypothetical protein
MTMLKISSKTHIASAAVFAALAIVPMGARAEDGGTYEFPAANVQDARIEEREPKQLTCVEATKAAWFERQLELSDGNVDPTFDMPRECQREIHATADKAKE